MNSLLQQHQLQKIHLGSFLPSWQRTLQGEKEKKVNSASGEGKRHETDLSSGFEVGELGPPGRCSSSEAPLAASPPTSPFPRGLVEDCSVRGKRFEAGKRESQANLKEEREEEEEERERGRRWETD